MASKKNEAYIEFKANTSEFQKGIKQMNAELKTATNELRLNATQLKGAGDSVDLLSERQSILQKELAASAQKVELTEKSLAECEATLGKNSKEYESLNNAVIAAKNQQQAIQNELDQTADKLAKITTENKQASTSFGQLGDKVDEQEKDLAALKKQYANVALEQGKSSKEAKDLAKEIDTLSSELSDNKKKLKEAENAADEFDNTLDDLADSAESAGDGFTVFKGALANIVSTGFTGLVNGAKNALSSIASLEEETREYRAEMGKLDTAFTTNKHSTETAEAAYRELYGIIGETDQSVEAAQQIALLAQSEEDVAKWAGYAAGVVGRFGDALQPETFYESANETLKLGEATGAYTQMLEGCGVNVEKFNEGLAACKTEGDKQAYMLKTTESLLGSASESYKETNADIIAANQANADYTDTLAGFGEKVAPVTTAAKEGFNGLLKEVLGLVEGADIEGFASSVSNAFATVKDTVLPAVVEGFGKLKEAWQWLSEHTGLLATIAATIGIVTTAITAYNIVQGIKTAMDAANVTTVWALVSAHIAQAAAAMAAIAPYVLIVAAIAAVIAIIVLCVKHWDKIKEKITEVAKKVKEKVTEIKNQITEKLNAAKQKAVEIFNNIKNGISQKINEAKNKVVEVFNNIKNAISQKLNEAKNKVNEIFNNIKNAISNKLNEAKNKVSSIFNNIKSTMQNIINNAKNAVVNVFSNLSSNVTSKINSLKSSVSNTFNNIKNAILTPIENARDKVKGIVDRIVSFFSNMKISLPKIKLPHLTISGSFSLNPPSVPKIGVQWYAKGGFFNKPTILSGLGEAGPEYALPLNERSLAPLAVMLNKLTATGENGLGDMLASRFDSAVDRLTERLERLEMSVNIDGERVATATASYNDTNSGARAQLAERGLSLA